MFKKLLRVIRVVCYKKWGMGVLLALWGVLIAGPYFFPTFSILEIGLQDLLESKMGFYIVK